MGKIVFLFLLFLAPSTLYGAALPADAKVELLDDFSFGKFSNASINKIPKNATTDLRNVYVDEKISSIVKGNGWIIVGSTVGPATLTKVANIYIYNKTNGSKEFLLTDNTRLVTTPDFMTYTPLKEGLNSTVDLRFLEVRGKVWCHNGLDSTFTYDGSTVIVLNGSTYGSNKTPDVPKGKFGAYNQDRVFFFNLSDNNSNIAFTSVRATDNATIAPDDFRAWPADNLIFVGRGDGQSGTFLKVFNTQLLAGKERSVYRISGLAPPYVPLKVNSQVGFISNESVTELDNSLFGQSIDGFYEMRGDARRISDAITPDIRNIRTDTTRVVENTWDIQGEFSNGNFNGSTASASGFVSMQTSTYAVSRTSDTSDTDQVFQFRGASTFTPLIELKANPDGIPPSYLGRLAFIDPNVPQAGWGRTMYLFPRSSNTCSGGSSQKLRVTLANQRTGQKETRETGAVVDAALGSFDDNSSIIFSSSIFWSGQDIINGTMTLKLEIGSSACSATQFYEVKYPSVAVLSLLLAPSTTVEYISEVSTATTLNSWGSFNSVRNTNGGAVNYFYRVATSAVNIGTYPWISISPGSVIGSSVSSNYIQWAATIAAVSTSNPSNIDSVTIDHVEGQGANTRSFGGDWLGRWWLGVSTESTGNYPLIYVKAKKTNSNPDAWMVFDGIPARCFARTSDTFYAGHSTWGAVMRLDYGTNYNGVAIDAYYDTPDMPFSNTFADKKLVEYWVDAVKSTGTSFMLGTSINGRAFNFQTVSLDGEGRLLKALYGVNAGNSTHGKTFRFRFRNNELDAPFTLHNFGIVYVPTQIRE